MWMIINGIYTNIMSVANDLYVNIHIFSWILRVFYIFMGNENGAH